MTNSNGQPEKMDELAQLATDVADRILEAQFTGRQIPPEQFTALVDAARLLEEQGVPWPPLVEEVLYEAGKRFSEAEAAPETVDPEHEDKGALIGLTRFFGGFRRG